MPKYEGKGSMAHLCRCNHTAEQHIAGDGCRAILVKGGQQCRCLGWRDRKLPNNPKLWGPKTGAPKIKVGRAPARKGNNALEEFFGLSYASWLTLPRILMADMPDRWQGQMARLCNEFFREYPEYDLYTLVQLTQGEDRKFISTPEWLTRQGYRHPEGYRHELNKMRGLPPGKLREEDQ